MNRNSLLAIGLVVLLTLAGCAGGGGGPTATSETATETPTATATPTPTPSPLETFSYPTGATKAGITNREALESTTRDYLNQTGYVLNASLDGHDENGSAQFVFRTRSNLQAKQIYSYQQEPSETRVYYRNGTSEYVKIIANGSTKYASPRTENDFAATHRASTAPVRITKLVMRFGNYSATDVVQRDGRTLVRYELEEPNWAVVDLDHFDRANGTLLIDERGVIHEATYHLRGERDNSRVEIDVSYRLHATGNVTVTKPAWLPKAKR